MIPAFPDLATTLIYCLKKEQQLAASLPARSPLKVKIVAQVFASDLYPNLDEDQFKKIDEALTKIFIAKAGEIELYATKQEGRRLYCDLIVKNVVITCTADGDGIIYLRNVNTSGRSSDTHHQINIAKQPY